MYRYADFLRGLASRELVFTKQYGVIKSDAFIERAALVVRRALLQSGCNAEDLLLLGGDFFDGGIDFDVYAVKKYMKNILGDASVYLCTPDGSISYKMDYILIAANVLFNRGRVNDCNKVLYLGFLLNAADIGDKLNKLTRTRGKPTKIGFRINTYDARVYEYHSKYMMYMTIPEGYKCYLYEPENLVHIVLLSRLAGMTPAEVKQFLANNNRGILIGDIDLQTEASAFNIILRNEVYRMNGYFGNAFRQAHTRLIVDSYADGSLNSCLLFSRELVPAMCDLMNQTFYIGYTADLSSNPAITDRDCFINYITPKSVSVCIKDGLDINFILPSVAGKMKEVGAFRMYDPLNYV